MRKVVPNHKPNHLEKVKPPKSLAKYKNTSNIFIFHYLFIICYRLARYLAQPLKKVDLAPPFLKVEKVEDLAPPFLKVEKVEFVFLCGFKC